MWNCVNQFEVNFSKILLFLCAALIISINNCTADDSFVENYEELSKLPLESYGAIPKCGEDDQKGRFMCVPYFNCDPFTNTVIDYPEVDGSNILSPRLNNKNRLCGQPLEVCCEIPNATLNTIEHVPTIDVEYQPKCGIKGKGNNGSEEAVFDEFPWTVALVLSQEPNNAFCGGSLLTPVTVLTSAHCVANLRPHQIKIRAGEWNFDLIDEPNPFQEREVSEIIIYPHHLDNALYNDAALLVLNGSLTKAKNIGTVCIPTEKDIKGINTDNCFVSGWGKKFETSNTVSKIMKKIEVSTIDNNQCQGLLRKELGNEFMLHHSFICANSIHSNSTICQGDGGSPLVCPDAFQRYYQMGIVSWGIGCGLSIPDVFTNVALFRDWIDSTLVEIGYNSSPYTAFH